MYAGQIKKSEGGSGQAVFWEKGEFHETSTEKGLMAIVMEAEDLERAILMPIKEESCKNDRKGKSGRNGRNNTICSSIAFEGTRKLSFKYRESD